MRIGLPASAMVRATPPTASMICVHSVDVLVSHHSLAGASTSPAASTATKPCCWPDTANATMRDRTEGSMSRKHACSAATQSAGSCSRLPSAALVMSSAALMLATMMRPAGS
ncbi:hypothetical protein D3C81_1880150 [compost metagenome]